MAERTKLLKRQQALANFGDFVLDHEDLDAILHEACRLIAQALDVDLAKVIEIERDGGTGLVRSGVGWSAGVVGHARIRLDGRSSEAFAIEQAQPVISNDIAAEERFEFAQFLRDHGVVALINVPIMLPRRRPWGVLQVDARVRRDFDQDDIDFLKTYAMVLSPVIDRFLVADERDFARKGLSHREERLLRVLDGMGEAFGLLSPDFTILEHNREALRLGDQSRDAVVGRSHWEIYPGSETSELGKLLRKAMDERVPMTLEHQYHLRSGAASWLETRVYPTSDGALAVFWRDITAQRTTDKALRVSEERLRQFGEASQDVLWIRDVETLQWQYLSPAFETVYGLTRQEALTGDNYRNWQDLILPKDRSHAIESIARVARGEQIVFEYRIRRPDNGQVRWLRDTDFLMGGDDGTALRIGGVGHDITALKVIEEALAAAEQRQRLLLEGMPQLVWRAVDDGRRTWASPQWIEYTGLSDAQSRGHGWLDALHPDDREAALAAWTQARLDGAYQVDYRIWDVKSGLYHWFQTRGTPIRRSDGSVVEWLGTSTDIDAQVRAREFLVRAGEELEQRVVERTGELEKALKILHYEAREREQAEERLRQSEKLKAVGQLTGGIAHDFNNMLQGITSALALVQTRLRQGRVEAAQDYIEPAQKAAERAGALTQRLLAFSRQQTLSPRAVSLGQVALGMEDMIRRAVGPAVQVELNFTDVRWRVLCDLNQMESALLNLCINARDAMPEGGWLTIGIEDRMIEARELVGLDDLGPGRYVVLSVTDTGSGMPPEVVARAFEPFFTTKPPGQGTGLGLSQIYGFMRQSGGLVQIETASGVGTTVRLALPVHEAEVNNTPGVSANGKTLLLVEDEHDLRRMLGDQLRDLGYGVLEADTAEAALRILHTGHHVNLLVTDVGLRGSMNGRQLAEAARAHTATLPVLLITGYAGEDLIGEDNVLRKPFKPAVLALRIREHIG